MAQVAGRANGRIKGAGVVLQTKSIEHPDIPQVITNDYEGMVDGQLAERQMFHYPPYYRLIYVCIRNEEPSEALLDLMAQTMAGKAACHLRQSVLGRINRRWHVLQTLFIPQNYSED